LSASVAGNSSRRFSDTLLAAPPLPRRAALKKALPTTANPTEEHDLFRAGDTIENPVTGERIVFRQTATETGGEAVVVETHVKPGGAVATAHFHPGQDERFRVLDGRLGLRVGGESLELGPGESATVPAGTVHKFWNAGTRRRASWPRSTPH